MAIVNNGLLGNLSGKLGKVVIYTLNGKLVMRSLPTKKRAKAKGRQKASQELFTQVMKPMQFAREFLRISFAGATGRSPYHSALSLNASRIAAAGSFSYAGLLFSQGKLAGASGITMSFTDITTIEVNWTGSETNKPALATDGAVLFAVVPGRQGAEFNLFAGKRGEGRATLKLKTTQPGDQLEVYLLFIEIEKSIQGEKYMISDSQWLGSLTA